MDSNKSLRILYMGTADFALEPLRRLVDKGYNIVSVVTMPDKPAGRGMKLRASKIKEYALSVGLPVLQPEKLKDEHFIQQLRELDLDLGIVVAFRMLPEVVWQMPRLGTINLHGSLLPRYRGAAPIHWAVINGDKETGVSCFQLKHELDTGDILSQASLSIGDQETTGEVYERLMWLGTDLLEETVASLGQGTAKAIPQAEMNEQSSHAPKLTKENTQLDWSRNAQDLANMVRGLNPFPSAFASLEIPSLGQASYKIHRAEAIPSTEESKGKSIGEVILTGRKNLDVVCGEGLLRIQELQPAGKRSMKIADFLNGLQLG